MSKSFGNTDNLLAIRESEGFSYDGDKWYREGDTVSINGDTFSCAKAVIKTVYENGKILIEHGTEETSLWLKDIAVSEVGNPICWQPGIIFALRETKKFSLDLENWFYIGQKCTVCLEDELYINAVILNIYDDGRILFEHEGLNAMIDYTKIAKIWDSSENIIYLFKNKNYKVTAHSFM